MISNIIAVRNQLQPKLEANSDILQFDYKFWTELESIAKKQRAAALKQVIAAGEDITTSGTVVRGKAFVTTLDVSKPVQTFDKDVFIDLIAAKHPEVPRHSLRELATAAVVNGSPRKTYRTEEIDV